MRYIKFKLKDSTPVKFKIRRLYPCGLDIKWKYAGKLNFSKYINLEIHRWRIDDKVEYLQQLEDIGLIKEYEHLIEEQHNKIKNTKRII